MMAMAGGPNLEVEEEHCFLWLQALEPRVNLVPTHDCIEAENYWGCLHLHVVGLTELFVGSGGVDLDEQGETYQSFAQQDGKFILPGSSFKGALRAIIEALSPSCIAVLEGKKADRNYGKRCQVKKDQRRFRLCPACGLFGAAGYRGRVSFQDGELLEGKPVIVKIAQRTKPRYCGPNGKANPCNSTFEWRKFYTRESKCTAPRDLEVLQVLKGARFALEVGFQNLRAWELGLLVLGLGIAPGHEFNWKIGGAKNRGCGLIHIKLQLHQSVYVQGRNWFFQQTAEWSEGFLQRVSEAYWEYLAQLGTGVEDKVKGNLRELRKEYGHDRSESGNA